MPSLDALNAVIRPAQPEDWPLVTALLEDAGLPTAGLENHAKNLFVLVSEGAVLGAVAFEDYRPYALLRSLVVAPEARGQGLGRRLLAFISNEVRRQGYDTAFGLTCTIPDLLPKLGSGEIRRDDLPPALMESAELKGACPVSARVFSLRFSADQRLQVLFLCTGNSCRSQMAEGWARALRGDLIAAYSAGIEKHGLNPRAVQVMAEAGVDIRGQWSKLVDEVEGVEFDYVITVCDRANESCPLFLGEAQVSHVGFDDPPALARDATTEEEALAHYRRVRDEIRAFVEKMPAVFTET